jgi:uncharacterized protein (TIGR02421 family)
MLNIAKYKDIDDKLFEAQKMLRVSYYLEPTNRDEQKNKFLSSDIKNPVFKYRDLEYSPKDLEKSLKSLRPQNDELGQIYFKLIENALNSSYLLQNRGDRQKTIEYSSKEFSKPGRDLVKKAIKYLEKNPSKIETAATSAKEVILAMQKTLKKYNITDWKIHFAKTILTNIDSGNKKINIYENKKFCEGDVERLCVHEICVHVFRAINGYNQPLKIFATGLPGYVSTEEGLTSYFEEMTGNSDTQVMRNYAARVIAVDSVLRDFNFKNTFDKIKKYNFSDEDAWMLAFRAHRGGGHIKDHVYLQGYFKGKEFARDCGDFKMLYIGEVGIEHLALVKRVLDGSGLKEARLLPPLTYP